MVVSRSIGLVRITSWYPHFNGSHFGLPPQLYPQNDWTGCQNRVDYDIFAQVFSISLEHSKLFPHSCAYYVTLSQAMEVEVKHVALKLVVSEHVVFHLKLLTVTVTVSVHTKFQHNTCTLRSADKLVCEDA